MKNTNPIPPIPDVLFTKHGKMVLSGQVNSLYKEPFGYAFGSYQILAFPEYALTLNSN